MPGAQTVQQLVNRMQNLRTALAADGTVAASRVDELTQIVYQILKKLQDQSDDGGGEFADSGRAL